MNGQEHHGGCSPAKQYKVGGYGEVHPADEEIQDVCDRMKIDFLRKSGVTASMFQAVSYRSQRVAGANYLVKVQYDDHKYTHFIVCVSQASSDERPALISYELDKTEDDELVDFSSH